MIYDPVDDELSESFELDRFIAVEFYENDWCSLYYIEFDRGHPKAQLKEGKIQN